MQKPSAMEDLEAYNPWKETFDDALLQSASTSTPARISDLEHQRGEVGSPAQESMNKGDISRVSADVLDEFDPLADAKETKARESSEQSEQTQGADEHSSVSQTVLRTSTSSTSNKAGLTSGMTIPSLVSLAKSLTLSRNRPQSLEINPKDLTNQSTQAASPMYTPARPALANATLEQANRILGPGTNTMANNSEQHELDETPAFDFQKFLDQMKTKGAEPVAKYLRSFLSNFAKRSFPVSEQIKVINEFLNFIAVKMREADVWKHGTEAEFDNAMEGMEKLVMNRLYEFTFTPQLAEAVPPRPITTDDLERDRVLSQRTALFGWIEEKHLEVPEGPDCGGFLMFAQQELLKINHYKAPRDKLICILNCCKVIFGLLRHIHREENADSFVPILIFVVLKANPPNLISNIEYIQRFRNPQKLQSETGYYFSSLMGAVQFIESMDHTGLSHITAEEFERNVEDAIHYLPASPNPGTASSTTSTPSRPMTPSDIESSVPVTPVRPIRNVETFTRSPHAGEESAEPLAISLGGVGNAFAEDTRRFLQRTGDALGKPLNALGRLLNDAFDSFEGNTGGTNREGAYLPEPSTPDGITRVRETPQTRTTGTGEFAIPAITTPYKPRMRPSSTSSQYPLRSPSEVHARRRGTPDSLSVSGTPSRSAPEMYLHDNELSMNMASPIPKHLFAEEANVSVSRTPTPALDIPGLQAEIDEAHARQADAALGTLSQIFPGTDREVIEWVLEAEGGDLGRSIEKLLEVGGGQ